MRRNLSCNNCQTAVDGIAYRSSCQHFLCPSCAHHAFGQSNKCPICEAKLNPSDVRELVVGMATASECVDNLFQILLQSADWCHVSANHQKILNGLVEVTMFVNTQLSLESLKVVDCNSNLKMQVAEADSKMMKMQELLNSFEDETISKQRQMESHLAATQHELVELKDAYKEKLRKCLAWEKAYGSLRDQISQTGTKINREESNMSTGRIGAGFSMDQGMQSTATAGDSAGTGIEDSGGGSISHHIQFANPGAVPALRRRTETTTFSHSFGPAPSAIIPHGLRQSSSTAGSMEFRHGQQQQSLHTWKTQGNGHQSIEGQPTGATSSGNRKAKQSQSLTARSDQTRQDLIMTNQGPQGQGQFHQSLQASASGDSAAVEASRGRTLGRMAHQQLGSAMQQQQPLGTHTHNPQAHNGRGGLYAQDVDRDDLTMEVTAQLGSATRAGEGSGGGFLGRISKKQGSFFNV